MSSIKNLLYMETHKLNSFLDVQHSVVRHIEMIATVFLCFYPDTLNESVTAPVDAYLPAVTERDFCGDFNHALLRHFESMAKANDADKLPIISVGHKYKNTQRRLPANQTPRTFTCIQVLDSSSRF